MNKKVYTKEELPFITQDYIDEGKASYRGCGFGSIDAKIKIRKKEYRISKELFNELGGIKKMRFAAPYRKEN